MVGFYEKTNSWLHFNWVDDCYFNYGHSSCIARAQALDAVKSTEGLKTDIASYYWQTGSFPDSGNAVMDAAAALKGKYYSANGVKIEAGTGIITTTFDKGANSGKNVVIIPTPNSVNRQIITWRCEGSVGKNRIPSTCQ